MELTIIRIREEAEGVKTFTLSPALPYKAGQFLSFDFSTPGGLQRRSYSLSSTPGVDEAVSISVKRVANGLMSRWLIDDAIPGDVLHTSGGATGLFTLPAEIMSPIWLFAAGIGITPIYSILKSALHFSSAEVVLVYSNRNQASAVFFDELQLLEQRYAPRLRIIWLFSDDKDLRRARFSKPLFPELLATALHHPPGDTLCYVCGPEDYMWLVQLLLQDAGVPADQIRREAFVIAEPPPPPMPPDTAPRQVRLTLPYSGGTVSFTNTFPNSILASAKEAGIQLPYSCNAGQCGSCTAICTAGEVWMSYNEVLTDADLRMGRVLTCTGHAIHGDVSLEF